MLDTMMDYDNEDLEDFHHVPLIIFLGPCDTSIMNSFWIESIASIFRYLRDMLDKTLDVDNKDFEESIIYH